MDMLGNVISIHALREEGDCCVVLHSQHGAISIHALREEGDEPSPASPATWTYFYPRPPRGGRLSHACTDAQKAQFLSTPSARRATLPDQYVHGILPISIHALREEGDVEVQAVHKAGNISIHALREEGDTLPRR